MTCVNCERTLKRGLNALPGMKEVSVSYQSGACRVVFDSQRLSFERIAGTVDALGYRVESRQARRNLRRQALLLAAIIAAYALLEHLGILNLLVPGQLADSGMSYGMLFVVGLLTSAHCIAMCGGINLSQCLSAAARPGDTSSRAAFAPSLLYNLGRVVSYTAVGFALGLIGMLLGGDGAGMPAAVQGAVKLFAGAAMVIMGLNMLGIFPWLRRLNLRLPGFSAKWIGKQKASQRRPFAVGLLNGLMPCGPLQSMQILALASASPVAGALSMLFFSLGTVPLMLGLGALVSALGRRFAHEVTNIGAALVAVLGLAMMGQGGSLSGLITPAGLLILVIGLGALGLTASAPFPRKAYRAACAAVCLAATLAAWQLLAPKAASPGELQAAAGGVQLIESTLMPRQYPTITVQAGTPVRWTIEAPARSINGCNEIMFIPEYELVHEFTEGENVIEFTPQRTGTFPYSCWMGMIRGSIVVK